jgi:hypothetical protein
VLTQALALLVSPQDGVTVVLCPTTAAELAVTLGCQDPHVWDWRYQLDTVAGPGGSRYRYDIWVGDQGPTGGGPRAEANPHATAAAHPLLEAFGILICGPTLLVARDGREYTLADWHHIRCGTRADAGLIGQNVEGPSALRVRGDVAPPPQNVAV